MHRTPRAASTLANRRNFIQALRWFFHQTRGRRDVAAVQKSCQLNGKSYPHGAEIGTGAKILTCADGEWSDRVNPFITVGP